MYTRRYPTNRSMTPPPDYSGTAIRREGEAPPPPTPGFTPPPALEIGNAPMTPLGGQAIPLPIPGGEGERELSRRPDLSG